jgi:hypothetical protein
MPEHHPAFQRFEYWHHRSRVLRNILLNRLRTTISGCIVIEAMLVDMKGPRATAAHGQYVSFVLSAGHHLYGRKETDLLRRSHRAINKG